MKRLGKAVYESRDRAAILDAAYKRAQAEMQRLESELKAAREEGCSLFVDGLSEIAIGLEERSDAFYQAGLDDPRLEEKDALTIRLYELSDGDDDIRVSEDVYDAAKRRQTAREELTRDRTGGVFVERRGKEMFLYVTVSYQDRQKDPSLMKSMMDMIALSVEEVGRNIEESEYDGGLVQLKIRHVDDDVERRLIEALKENPPEGFERAGVKYVVYVLTEPPSYDMPPNIGRDDLLTVQEVAKKYGKKPSDIRAAIRRGILDAYPIANGNGKGFFYLIPDSYLKVQIDQIQPAPAEGGHTVEDISRMLGMTTSAVLSNIKKKKLKAEKTGKGFTVSQDNLDKFIHNVNSKSFCSVQHAALILDTSVEEVERLISSQELKVCKGKKGTKISGKAILEHKEKSKREQTPQAVAR
jgi:hypothetical protein